MFFIGTFPDDGSGSDLYYSTVSDGIEDGNAEYDFFTDFPWTGYCIWYIPYETGVYGSAKRSGGSCQIGWL